MLNLVYLTFASLVTAFYFGPEVGHATCILTKLPGIPLPTPKDPNNNLPECAEGFYCNGFDPGNNTTYPVFCPPTPQCAFDRSVGLECDMSMGTYEPRLCQSGHYCPKVLGPKGRKVMEDVYVVADQYAQELPCPKGYYCPQGTSTPLKCPDLSVCKEQANGVRYYGSFVLLVIMIIILILVTVLYRTKLYKSNFLFNFEDAILSPCADDNLKTDVEMITTSGSTEPLTIDTEPIRDESVSAVHVPEGVSAVHVPEGVSTVAAPESFSAVDVPSVIAPDLKVLAHGFKKARGDNEPLRIKFNNLKLFMPIPKGRHARENMKTDNETEERPGYKQILCGCSGDLKPGQVTAIMGPSGAGKTVLFNLLLGRIPDNWIMEGTLSVNGNEGLNVVRGYRPRMGYVPQTDILHRELTVGHNLNFSAQLRLSSDWTDEEKKYFVAAVVDSMRLKKQQDVPVGDEENRGVSGGQRRRTSIGCELAAAPSVLFLDQPTNGLDSSTALEVCNCLREVAREAAVTVAMVLHQPRVEIWNELDTVLFLIKGAQTAYKGPQAMAQRYFETVCGVKFPVQSNPADVILDAILADGKRLAKLWVDNMYTFFEEEKEEKEDEIMTTPTDPTTSYDTASFRCQFVQVHRRSLYKQVGDLQLLMVELVITVLSSLVIGLSLRDIPLVASIKEYSQIESSPFDAFYPQIVMYCVMSVALAASTASVGVFGGNRLLYFHEAASGCNRLAYFLGMVCSFLFRTIFSALIFSSFFQIISGSYMNFWELMLLNFLLIHNAYAMGSIITNFLEVKDASLVAAVASAIFGCFSGYIKFPRGVKYLSYGFWYANALADMFYQPTSQTFKVWLPDWGYIEDGKWIAMGILTVYGVLLYVVAFLCMIFIDRDKQR